MRYFGDITKLRGADLPTVDVVTGGSPCICAGSLINTDKGLIPIEDITIGTKVLTHNNRYKSVYDCGYTGTKETLKLTAMGLTSLCATKNHPFYVRRRTRVWNNDKRTYERVFSEPEWVELGELSKDYYIGSPVNNIENNDLKLTDEECWLIGRYIADGYIRNTQRNNRPIGCKNHQVIYCVGKNKIEYFESKLSDYIGSKSEERTAIRYKISSSRLVNLCSICGSGAINKEIPLIYLNLPIDKLSCLLDGYLSGDGCFTNNHYQATSISKKLVITLGEAVSKVYKRPYSINYFERPDHCEIEGRIVNQRPTYMIFFKKDNNKQDKAFYEDGYIWCPINKIEEAGKCPVYNLSVSDDESYCVENFIVHNCQNLSLAGKRDGLEGDRSILFLDQIRIIKEMREESKRNGKTRDEITPRYMVWENVPGAFSTNKGHDFQTVLTEIIRIAEPDSPDVPMPEKGK